MISATLNAVLNALEVCEGESLLAPELAAVGRARIYMRLLPFSQYSEARRSVMRLGYHNRVSYNIYFIIRL